MKPLHLLMPLVLVAAGCAAPTSSDSAQGGSSEAVTRKVESQEDIDLANIAPLKGKTITILKDQRFYKGETEGVPGLINIRTRPMGTCQLILLRPDQTHDVVAVAKSKYVITGGRILPNDGTVTTHFQFTLTEAGAPADVGMNCDMAYIETNTQLLETFQAFQVIAP